LALPYPVNDNTAAYKCWPTDWWNGRIQKGRRWITAALRTQKFPGRDKKAIKCTGKVWGDANNMWSMKWPFNLQQVALPSSERLCTTRIYHSKFTSIIIIITRSALGRAHLPPTTVFRRLKNMRCCFDGPPNNSTCMGFSRRKEISLLQCIRYRRREFPASGIRPMIRIGLKS